MIVEKSEEEKKKSRQEAAIDEALSNVQKDRATLPDMSRSTYSLKHRFHLPGAYIQIVNCAKPMPKDQLLRFADQHLIELDERFDHAPHFQMFFIEKKLGSIPNTISR